LGGWTIIGEVMATQYETGLKLKLPDTGDKGSVWFPALEYNITQTNDHVHDGSVGAVIPSTNIGVVTQALSSSDWVADVNGAYVQEKTVPNGKSYANVFIMVKNAAGEQLFLDVKPGTASTKYKVYSNDSSLSATAYFLV
jgi:hypothetical protein